MKPFIALLDQVSFHFPVIIDDVNANTQLGNLLGILPLIYEDEEAAEYGAV
jgi:hypothetical protein